ncbi:MAG: NAD(P)-dependent oxidoreductase, partial [Bacillota bacterium]
PVNVDVEAAAERGIPVLYTPGRNANAVAELTVGLMILLARRVRAAEEALRRDPAAAWAGAERKELVGVELNGKVLGIVGFGLVGKLVCRLALAFGMKVSAHDPYVELAAIEAYGAKAAGLEEVLETSDFLSLHLRESADSAGFMDRTKFSQMKRSAYFINTARGSLVDESALLEALDTGLIAGAALDVFAIEPLQSDSPLLRQERCSAASHRRSHT